MGGFHPRGRLHDHTIPPRSLSEEGEAPGESRGQEDGDSPELLNRGHQLLLELDRIHARIHDEVKSALRPEPQAWKGARLAKGDYDQLTPNCLH
jgi:hypothetical protein